MNAAASLKYFLPELFLLAGAFFVLFLDFFAKNKRIIGVLALLTLSGTAFLAFRPETSQPLFYGFFQLDAFTHFFRMTALAIVAMTILISFAYKRLPGSEEGEYYSLFLFMAFGLILMAASANLLMIFLAVEFVSILSYLLVGFLKRDMQAKEASVKYLLFGSLASGTMLYGMSLLFGLSGSLELGIIHETLARFNFGGIAMAAFILFLVGLGFKISMAPFHLWAPDAYQAAPTPVSAFLTVGPKALGFALLARVLFTGFDWMGGKAGHLIILFSILTMTIGNVIAIAQTNIKRLLAYSSIAQAGYILMGLAVFNKTGLTAVLVYLIAYAFTNLGAFTVVIIASNHFGDDEIQSYAGLARRAPFLAASLTVFFLSLAGIPPLAGFIGKFFVFSAAIEKGLVTLAVAAALNSAVAAFYYFKVVRLMYLVPANSHDPIPQSASLTFALILLLVGTLAVGLIPNPVLAMIQGVLVI